MPQLQQFDVVSAVFKPQRTDDLKPEAMAMVGQRFTFIADFRIDEGFAYEGDWHMTLTREDSERTGIFWVPGCDLADIKRLRAMNVYFCHLCGYQQPVADGWSDVTHACVTASTDPEITEALSRGTKWYS